MSTTSSSSKHVPARHATRTISTTPTERPFEVRRSRIQGRGVFATRKIRKGTRLIQYVGQPISHEEADRRYDDQEGRHHTFLFVLDEDTVLDARRGGNDARFINHSCEPNCETEIEDGEIWIGSIAPIAPESELVYDYRFDWDDAYEPDDVRYYACRCGSAKCRGTILRVPVYLRATVKQWLAGNDVPKPRKPKKKVAGKQGVTKKKSVVKQSVAKKAAKKKTATAKKATAKKATAKKATAKKATAKKATAKKAAGRRG